MRGHNVIAESKDVTLLEILDRVMDKGVVTSGDVVISVADVDLVYVGLRALVSSVETMERLRGAPVEVFPRRAQISAQRPMAALQFHQNGPRLGRPMKNVVRTDSPGAFLEELEKPRGTFPRRIAADPRNAEKGLAKLVMTLIELIRKLMEKQAMRRIENGSLTEAEIERVGETLMKLENKMKELKRIFGLQDEDLNLNLGPLGNLM
ncbi:MAG: gas vesicle protein K [Elusimicrobia bacterium]|nr:gas vesicle protein K [Elusimicrobiota bacterium]